jgi:hypothetical protein
MPLRRVALLLLAVALQVALFDADASRADAQLELLAPRDRQELVGLVPLVEVKGRAGVGELRGHDVVIALDESSSTLRASGGDVDGDGVVGQPRRPGWTSDPAAYCSDPGDSILRAELAASRALLERLDPESTRAALVTFSGEARVRAPLGDRRRARAAVDGYQVYFDRTGTSLVAALQRAADVLARAPATPERRHRSVILLSDGAPTLPTPQLGRFEALVAAERLAQQGIRVFAFGLGKDAVGDAQTYEGIAERSGGRFVALDAPAQIVEHAVSLQLAGLESIEVRNATTGEPGRAARVLADGSFDSYVDLATGRNVIEVVARLDGGGSLVARRAVTYRRPERPTAADERAAAELTERLRVRTLELELERRTPRPARPVPSREVTIEVEEPGD